MKILMLVNWKIEYCSNIPNDKQPPNYYVKGMPYWFFRHFRNAPDVDVIDISSFKWLEGFEKNKLRFYVFQALKAIPRLNKYDLIVSHGMQSGVVISLLRRFWKTKAKHIVFDIGSFNSAAESGFALRLMQFASKSIDGIIYHTSRQLEYYKKFFPWIVDKAEFIKFGADLDFFKNDDLKISDDRDTYILCAGSSKLDRTTVVEAYSSIDTDVKLRFVGSIDEGIKNVKGVEQLDYVPVREFINQVYNARFCVLPFKWFNHSGGQMRLMQEMALGKCVLASRVPSLTDYIIDGKNAIMYEPGNSKDCGLKMKMLLENSELINSISEEAPKYLAERCNEKTMALAVEAFLENMLVKR